MIDFIKGIIVCGVCCAFLVLCFAGITHNQQAGINHGYSGAQIAAMDKLVEKVSHVGGGESSQLSVENSKLMLSLYSF